MGKISNNIIKEIQLHLYNKIVNFDILLMGKFKQGSLQSRFINDLNILREAITIAKQFNQRPIHLNWLTDEYDLFRLDVDSLCNSNLSLCIKPIIYRKCLQGTIL